MAFNRFDDWLFNYDDGPTLGVIKLVSVSILGVMLFLGTLGLISGLIDPHQRAVLDLTTEFSCTVSHQEYQNVLHGRTHRWEWVTVCDNYKRTK